MRSDPAKERFFIDKLESETDIHGHGTFPSIGSTDESFDPEGRVLRIIEKKRGFCFEKIPDVFRQGAVFFAEPVAEFINRIIMRE